MELDKDKQPDVELRLPGQTLDIAGVTGDVVLLLTDASGKGANPNVGMSESGWTEANAGAEREAEGNALGELQAAANEAREEKAEEEHTLELMQRSKSHI